MKSETNAGPVVSYSALVDALATELKLPKKTVTTVIEGFAALAAKELKSGKRVQVKALGNLLIREGRGGAAGQDAVSRRAVLVPAKQFKDAAGV